MNIKVKFTENNATMAASFGAQPKATDVDMGALTVLHDGQNGATFYPAVSEDGIISWTNNRELDNPPPVNIKGPKGDPGATPTKGKDYFDGAPGVSATHEWNGTVLTITSASGVSSADLKGDKGDPGKTPVKGVDYFDGEPGKPGYTPVKGVDYFDGKDGYTPVKGKDYFDGEPGKAPVKGTDYFTDADKAEMVNAVKEQLIVEQWTFTLMDNTTVTKDVVTK